MNWMRVTYEIHIRFAKKKWFPYQSLIFVSSYYFKQPETGMHYNKFTNDAPYADAVATL